MAEATKYEFSHKEVVEALLKQQGLHEGIWGLHVEFGIGAANVGPSPDDLNPAAIIPVVSIGLQKANELTSISVDASVVNPVSAKTVSAKTK